MTRRGIGSDRNPKRYLNLAAAVRDRPMEVLTHADIAELAGLHQEELDYARQLASQLVRNRVVLRLSRGLYFPNRPSEGVPWLGPLLLQLSGDGFVSHGTAMRVHLGTWSPANGEVQVTTDHVARQMRIAPGMKLVRVSAGMAWRHPRERVDVPGFGWVDVADSVSTAIDALESPRLCGGFFEVARYIARLRHTWSPENLAEVAQHAPEVSVARLGYLLERVGAVLPKQMLDSKTRAHRQHARLDLGGPKAGELEPTWRLRVNVAMPELRACFAQG